MHMIRHQNIASDRCPVLCIRSFSEHPKSRVHSVIRHNLAPLVRIECDEVKRTNPLKQLNARRPLGKSLHAPEPNRAPDPKQACSRGTLCRVPLGLRGTECRGYSQSPTYRTFFTRTPLNRPITGNFPTSGLA